MKEWPGKELNLKWINLIKGGKIEILGYNNSLEWTSSNEGLTVKFPVKFQNEKSKPHEHAWILKIKLDAS